MDLLEAFTEHWKGITGYYLEATGEWGAGRGSLCPRMGSLCPRMGSLRRGNKVPVVWEQGPRVLGRRPCALR